MPSNLGIDIAEGTPLEEPEFLYLGFQRGRARPAVEPTTHGIAARTVTRVDVALPALHGLSTTARALETRGLLNAAFGNTADLRPDVPLILQW